MVFDLLLFLEAFYHRSLQKALHFFRRGGTVEKRRILPAVDR
jgi:hypothetical protein